MSARVVRIAREWIGTPYRHRACIKGVGADCLGLIIGVWKELGCGPVDLPVYNPSWQVVDPAEKLWAAAEGLLRPGRRQLLPGDIALFRMRDGAAARHMGIISGTWRVPRVIHAYSGRGVVESMLDKPLKRRIVARFRFPQE